jgi:hypothetical protein
MTLQTAAELVLRDLARIAAQGDARSLELPINQAHRILAEHVVGAERALEILMEPWKGERA